MNEQAIFIAALTVEPDRRGSYLEEACGTDEALRRRVERLLAAHEHAGSFLDYPGAANPAAEGVVAAPATEELAGKGDHVGSVLGGKYKLIEEIGEGGMGSVYMAQQTEPVRRAVAVKVIKAGMDSKAVLARFGAERQALAMMDHPSIARVLDAGATDSGRPYFVMELVKGVPITQYCDDHKLTTRQRLELFVPVCNAIQHAHQKGIIHRDIKPNNVLVAMYDDRPVPKVIDFGIAKATGAALTDLSIMTGFGAIVGTPEYMSPEQANDNNMDIDTRSDVYSLGVLLYELLTGSTPVDRKSLGKAAILEILRIVCEVEAPKPSAKLSTIDTLPSVAANRSTEPAKLSKLMKGELDWVVLKALEKDRVRRYDTANGLARDIQRYLADEVVEARPPSTGYRLKKLVRRNKGPVIAASLVLLTLVGGIVGTSIGFAQAIEAREAESRRAESEARQRLRAETAEAETRKRADELQRVSDFQSQMLGQVNPASAGLRLSGDIKAKFAAALAKADVPEAERTQQAEVFASQWSRINATDAALELIDGTILKPAIEAIDRQFKDQPVVDAALRATLAERYVDLGLYDAATPLLERALETRRRVLGGDHADTMTSIGNAGNLLMKRGKLDQAMPYYREELDNRRRVFGADHPSTLVPISNMGMLLGELHRAEEALPYYTEALEKRRRVLGEDHPDTLSSASNLGAFLRNQGKLDEAMTIHRDTLERRRRVLGEDHPATVVSVGHVGGLLVDHSKWSEAVACFREVLEKRRRLLGDVHPRTLMAISNLGTTLSSMGNQVEAEALMREALSQQTRLLGADHPSTLNSASNLAVFLIRNGKAPEAEAMCHEVLDRRRRVMGRDHPDTLISINIVGFALLNQNKPAQAEPFIRDAIAISGRINGEDHMDTLLYTHNLGALLQDQKKANEAEPLFRTVIERAERTIGRAHPMAMSATAKLAGILYDQRRLAESAAVLATAEPFARKATTPAGERSLAELLTNLGKARMGLNQLVDAEAGLLESHRIWIKTRGEDHADTRHCIRAIIDLYTTWHAAEPGKGYDTKADQWKAKLPQEVGPPPPQEKE